MAKQCLCKSPQHEDSHRSVGGLVVIFVRKDTAILTGAPRVWKLEKKLYQKNGASFREDLIFFMRFGLKYFTSFNCYSGNTDTLLKLHYHGRFTAPIMQASKF
jgi:hypothetical protein